MAEIAVSLKANWFTRDIWTKKTPKCTKSRQIALILTIFGKYFTIRPFVGIRVMTHRIGNFGPEGLYNPL